MVLTDRPRLLAHAGPFVILLLILTSVSAAWIESDAYRVGGGLLFVAGFLCFTRANPKPTANWINLVCIGWAFHVAFRMGVAYHGNAGGHLGTSEGIYLFTALYPTIGYALSRYPDALERSVWAFIAISLAALVASVPVVAVFDGDRHEFLFTENTIHSSVSGGFIMFAAVNFAGHIWRRDHGMPGRWLWLVIAYLIVLLCAVGILGAKSKGVWFAVGVGLFAQLLMLPGGRLHAHGFAAGAALLAALAAMVAIAWDNIWASIGPSVQSASWILDEARRTGSLSDAVQTAVAYGQVPLSMHERLILWANAVETWSHNIVFGNGILWEKLFLQAHYKDVGYNILHNGYFEIAVRYGLTGLAFYGLLIRLVGKSVLSCLETGCDRSRSVQLPFRFAHFLPGDHPDQFEQSPGHGRNLYHGDGRFRLLLPFQSGQSVVSPDTEPESSRFLTAKALTEPERSPRAEREHRKRGQPPCAGRHRVPLQGPHLGGPSAARASSNSP